MHNKPNTFPPLRLIAAGLVVVAAGSAHAEVYYESVPVLDVTPIIVSKRVPVRERICEQPRPPHRLSQTHTGDVRQGRPRLRD